MTDLQFEQADENRLRWEFIEKATKDIDSWTDSEKAEIHPQRFSGSTHAGETVATEGIPYGPQCVNV